jgi:hypothetical protein
MIPAIRPMTCCFCRVWLTACTCQIDFFHPLHSQRLILRELEQPSHIIIWTKRFSLLNEKLSKYIITAPCLRFYTDHIRQNACKFFGGCALFVVIMIFKIHFITHGTYQILDSSLFSFILICFIGLWLFFSLNPWQKQK